MDRTILLRQLDERVHQALQELAKLQTAEKKAENTFESLSLALRKATRDELHDDITPKIARIRIPRDEDLPFTDSWDFSNTT